MAYLNRTIVFSNSKLKSSFRFEDNFQVLPLNMEVKPQNQCARHFPIILEFSIDDNEIDRYERLKYSTALYNRQKEIINLLSCLTNHRFFSYDTSMNGWGIGVPNKPIEKITKEEFDIFNKQESCWYISGYFYRGLKKDMIINRFSDYSPKAILKEARMHEYYINNPIDDYQHEICFPNTLPTALHFYYGLSENIRRKVNSSIYLACDGMDISAHKRSLSFLSYISAIEGLIDLDVNEDEIEFECGSCKTIKSSPYKCPVCGRPIWGIKQKFVNFLSKYVSMTEKSQKKYKKIYDLRSSITHTGQLFLGDYNMSFNEERKEKDENDWLMRLETLQLFRIALDSWLRDPQKKKQ